MNNNWWFYKDYLAHHGRKGQRWGVRNGPPYPLDAKTAARVSNGQEKVRVSKSEYQKKRKDKNELTVGLTHIAARPESKYAEVLNDNTDRTIAEVWQEDPSYLKNHEKFQNELDLRKHMKAINPTYGQQGRNNNCSKCTAALEMARRGYDVSAGSTLYGQVPSCQQYWFDGAVPTKVQYGTDSNTELSSDDKFVANLLDEIRSYGRNSSGEIDMKYPDGSGHSMYFFTDKENHTRLYDGQSNKSVLLSSRRNYETNDYSKYESSISYTTSSGQTRYKANPEWEYAKLNVTDLSGTLNDYGFDFTKGATVTRLDNATPNFKHMAEDNVVRPSYDSGVDVIVKDRKDGRYFAKY